MWIQRTYEGILRDPTPALKLFRVWLVLGPRQVGKSPFPKLAEVTDPEAIDLYLTSYVQTCLERDVRELLGIQKRREFEVFVRMCALRSAQLVNLDELARDARISPVTAKEWLSLLEDSFLIRLIHPHHSNRTKRLIRSPKLYFLDAGLAAWLAGWRDPDALRLGPLAGAIFETHVFGQLLRHFRHRARSVEITFWRTRDGEEIDFLVEAEGRIMPIVAELGTADGRSLPRLRKIAEPSWQPGHVLSLAALDSVRPGQTLATPRHSRGYRKAPLVRQSHPDWMGRRAAVAGNPRVLHQFRVARIISERKAGRSRCQQTACQGVGPHEGC